ncbi:MAG: hypothetical protein ACK5PT_20020, partial [Cereibacter sp.]
ELRASPASEDVQEYVAQMNTLGVLTALEVMIAGQVADAAATVAVAPSTPVRVVMEHLRDGAGAVSVAESGAVIGTIRAEGLMGRLLNPQGPGAHLSGARG